MEFHSSNPQTDMVPTIIKVQMATHWKTWMLYTSKSTNLHPTATTRGNSW